MATVAEVCVNIPARSLNRLFSYQVPENMTDLIVGARVLVPFGARKAEGFVISISCKEVADLKPIIEVLDIEPWFDDKMIALAEWIQQRYQCSLAEALRLFVPGNSGIRAEKLYFLPATAVCAGECFAAGKPKIYSDILACLKGQEGLTASQLTAKFGKDAAPVLASFVRHKIITVQPLTKTKLRHKLVTAVCLAVDKTDALAAKKNLAGKPAQIRLLDSLIERKILYPQDLKSLKLSRDTVAKLTDAGLVSVKKIVEARDSYAEVHEPAKTIAFTPEQRSVLNKIIPAVAAPSYRPYLLHGITGSGKTEIYIEIAAEARRHNRQAIVLVPEIALTGQIVRRFKARFGSDVVVFHSKLSIGERYDSWQRLRSGDAGIIIGARSALFCPVNNLGVVIIDEEHEHTYKQENSPRYHARDVALQRAKLHGAPIILGSATPSIESYYEAVTGKYELLVLQSRTDGSSLPETIIVDMRSELKAGRRSVISHPLAELLGQTLCKGEQAILLLNRRGYSTFVMCRECGHVINCNKCSVPLVYHLAGNRLSCHYCQAAVKTPDICPVCSSRYIKFFGAGTQKVEEELAQIFPSARIVRMDQDTTGGKLAHDKILGDFAAGKYDILLGTQMVAKGHDIKNVTAVGVISADTALNLPDFRAAEKTFSLIAQTAGRAGRGAKPGKVIIQTYNPEHYAIKAGANHDYKSFYQDEILLRRSLSYPPFVRIIKFIVQCGHDTAARKKAEDLAAMLKQIAVSTNTQIIGPYPAAIHQINNIFRHIILAKGESIDCLLAAISRTDLVLRSDVVIDIDPVSVM